jgi:methionyl-tRNA formyltransferase
MLKKEIAQINWEKYSATQIKNLVRGLNPIMGAYTFLKEKKIKIWNVDVINEEELINLDEQWRTYKYRLEELEAGTILISDEKIGLFIKAKDGIISVNEIQGENARRMNIKDYLRGNNLPVGEILEFVK